ncbi:MAG: ATP-binding protein [Opitutales bacterium]|nr:ATP-binding protein [Opitutales bacterium]
MILKDTIFQVLRDPMPPLRPAREVKREVAATFPRTNREAIILKGVRRSGKSTLLFQQMRRCRNAVFCNFEDTRLFGFGPDDFTRFIECVQSLAPSPLTLFLDEVQEVEQWERLVRALLDKGHSIWVSGSNASLLTREVGAKLTGRHRSFEIFPFTYGEFLKFRKLKANAASLDRFMREGGFPSFLADGDGAFLQTLLRDIVLRDIALRHNLRETRHLMNLVLFLLAHTGQPFSLQKLSKVLQIPSVNQTGAYLGYLEDAYLLQSLPKHSHSFKKRVVTPRKYYAVDNGLAAANNPQATPDRGCRLENQVFLALRQRGIQAGYDSETDLWECDFVYDETALQVCLELNDTNREREIKGLLEAIRASRGRLKKALILTLNQSDQIEADGQKITLQPAWKWL